MTDLDCPSRRDLLRALGTAGITVIGAGVLVACGSGDSAGGTTSPAATSGTPAGTTGSPTVGETAAPTGSSAPAAPAGFEVPLADVPVGEARVVDAGGRQVVLARTAETEVLGWSAVCTHQNAIVQENGGLALRCPLHFSEFDAADGLPTKGPATRALDAVPVTVSGDVVVIA